MQQQNLSETRVVRHSSDVKHWELDWVAGFAPKLSRRLS